MQTLQKVKSGARAPIVPVAKIWLIQQFSRELSAIIAPLPRPSREQIAPLLHPTLGEALHSGDSYFVQYDELAGVTVPTCIAVHTTIAASDRRSLIQSGLFISE